MAKFPVIAQNPQVAGPANQRRATANDILPGLEQGIASARQASSSNVDAATAQAKATGAVAAAAGSFGESLDRAGDALYKYEVQNQISNAHVRLAKEQSSWNAELKKRVQAYDPNGPDDPNVTQGILKDFDKAAEKWSDSYSTREAAQYVNQTAAETRGHLFVQATESDQTLAGFRAKAQMNTELNERSSSTRSDPSANNLKFQLEQFDKGIELRHGKLGPELAAHLRTAGRELITVSSIEGAIELDAKTARKGLTGGQWDSLIDGHKKDQLIAEADRTIKATEEEKRRQQALAEAAAKKAEEQRFNGLLDQSRTSKGLSNIDVLRGGISDHTLRNTLYGIVDDITRRTKLETDLKNQTDAVTGFLKTFGVKEAQGLPQALTPEFRLKMAGEYQRAIKESSDVKEKDAINTAYAFLNNGDIASAKTALFAKPISDKTRNSFLSEVREEEARRAEALDKAASASGVFRMYMSPADPNYSSLGIKSETDIRKMEAAGDVSRETASYLSKVLTIKKKNPDTSPWGALKALDEQGKAEAWKEVKSGRITTDAQAIEWARKQNYGPDVLHTARDMVKDFEDPTVAEAKKKQWAGFSKAARSVIAPDNSDFEIRYPEQEVALDAFNNWVRSEIPKRLAEDKTITESDLLNELHPKTLMKEAYKWRPPSDADSRVKMERAMPEFPVPGVAAQTPQGVPPPDRPAPWETPEAAFFRMRKTGAK